MPAAIGKRGTGGVFGRVLHLTLTLMLLPVAAPALGVSMEVFQVVSPSRLTLADSTAVLPFNTLGECLDVVVPGGTVRMAEGGYSGPDPLWQPVRLEAYGGVVTVGP
jgi:hypothetical protein